MSVTFLKFHFDATVQQKNHARELPGPSTWEWRTSNLNSGTGISTEPGLLLTHSKVNWHRSLKPLAGFMKLLGNDGRLINLNDVRQPCSKKTANTVFGRFWETCPLALLLPCVPPGFQCNLRSFVPIAVIRTRSWGIDRLKLKLLRQVLFLARTKSSDYVQSRLKKADFQSWVILKHWHSNIAKTRWNRMTRSALIKQ